MFDPNNHFKRKPLAWNATEAQGAIEDIVDDHIQALADYPLVPRHPMDGYGLKSDLYMGLAGVVWGITYLQTAGVVRASADLAYLLDPLLAANKKDHQGQPHASTSSYLFGALPILMMKYKLEREPDLANEIFRSVENNNTRPVCELMWGSAGTMLCANFMHRWTGEPRWRDVFLFQAERMLGELEEMEGVGHIWTQDLYGTKAKYLGPVHGFAGNLIPLIEGKDLLESERYHAVMAQAAATLVNTAVSDESHANWPDVVRATEDMRPLHLLQHCHGAAGMINALSKIPLGMNDDFDRLLEKGGQLVWDAGPLRKGANICHGSAGNGYALLKLYQRSGDDIWLDRARAFAMNAIDQYRATREVFHQGRYTLWTGDLGTAFFLRDCITGEANFPTIDIF